jgi:hypothetical protein
VLLAEIGCAAGGLEFEDDPGLRPDQWILRVD